MNIQKLSPETVVKGIPETTIGDFWQWAYSDILSNRNRSIFAEFIVASVLGVTDNPRVEWDETDIRYQGKKIEVKSSAYLQSWKQTAHSRIVFDIGKKMAWIAESNTWLSRPERVADCYIFCVYSEKDPQKANILDLTKWEFYLALTKTLDDKLGDQKSITLNSLMKIVNRGPITIGELKSGIDNLLI